MCVGIICACLPNFKPFLRRHFPKVLGSSYHSDAFTPHFSRRTANTIPDTLTQEYELKTCAGCRKSVIAQKKDQQTGTNNESQEDILGDGYSRGGVTMTPNSGPLS
jgi:hypothetical protein